ncbi:reverse transcriptase domain-containing protein [Tanacetum coccineum]
MLAIFHDVIEESVEVFMDNFYVFGNSFDKCLNNLDKMLQRCKDSHLVLNWEKCHFMVKEGIVLGHKVSSTGLEVDKAKIDVILKLPPPTNIKGVRSFLGHAGFYRRFIKESLKIARPITKLLEKDTPFEFNDECQKTFELLKEKLTCAPVIVSPNWNILLELICDASDFAVGAVLGTENVVTNHLSRIDNNESSDDSEVDDNFPGEPLMEINTMDEPWFADFANYLAVVDNAINRRSQELLKVIKQIRGECDVMKERERARDEECEALRAKCEAAMMDFDNNLVVVALREKISTLSSEAREHKANLGRMILESEKWAGYQVSLSTLESKVASLEAKKTRLEAIEAYLRQKVDDVKCDRILLWEMCCFRRDPSASIEDLLSKKPPTLQRPAPSRNQAPVPSSQKDTPYSALVSTSMSPHADVSSAKL